MKKAARPSRPAGPLVGVVMGSTSDWETMKHADELLTRFGVAHECRVMSAHRSPKLTAEWAASAEKRGLAVIIAAAGGAAHLAGVLASHTVLPVLGVPMESASLKGLDSLLSTVQMPAGVPVGTLGIRKARRRERRPARRRHPRGRRSEAPREAAEVPRRPGEGRPLADSVLSAAGSSTPGRR